MEPFKNIYNKEEIQRLANEVLLVYPSFQQKEFINYLLDETWEEKELKQRMRSISTSLGKFLPNDYLQALEVLKKIQDKFNGLFHLIFPDFVEVYGIDYYDESIDSLKFFTTQSSSEFAIRPFFSKYPQLIELSKEWALNKNEHIRRLASEGCRPRLPWGIALQQYKKDPTKVLEVLELLKDDESVYVQKSVANNLNDISKDNPQTVKKILKSWYGNSKNTNWIVKHASRTLLKAGDTDVLEIFGYSSEGINVSNLEVIDNLKLNEYLDFSFKISSKTKLGKLRIEYKLGLLRQKNKINYKVFKISERNLQDKELTINKSYHFKEVTTRKYYSGIHTLTIVVNGKEFQTKEFKLTV
ncbi:DNA alkylation repair protein [Sulfurimonas sp.]|nr:DNA alkylation repair protein [Sulfurimonas sp.]